jgi:hypothetical protein
MVLAMRKIAHLSALGGMAAHVRDDLIFVCGLADARNCFTLGLMPHRQLCPRGGALMYVLGQ